MGKRRHNSKARQVITTSIDNSLTNEIKLEFGSKEYGNSDTSNLLALPSKKRKTKLIEKKKEKTRFLSKAHRKKLEKILDKKKKKENRSALLESLSHVQASSEEIKQLTAISTAQTLGLKRLNNTNVLDVKAEVNVAKSEREIKRRFNTIRGAYKRKHLLKLNPEPKKKAKIDLNVIGLDTEALRELYASTSDFESDDDVVEVNNQISQHSDIRKNDDTGKEMPVETISKTEDSKTEYLEAEVKTNVKKTDNTSLNTGKRSKNKTVQKDGDIQKEPECGSAKSENKTKNTSLNSSNKSKENVESVQKDVEIKKEPKIVPAKYVAVNRDPKIQVARLKLPILAEEQNIMELINENDVVIIAGETGSGKTTQIPQFLYEAGYARRKMIAVTEPRRVAAVAMAERVAYEMGLTNKEVSYLIRFEGNVTKDTKIKFMTDGVLLKEIKSDYLMSNYSVVIIDEAHERSVSSDILLGLLSKAIPLRRNSYKNPLKLIIMSATLRVEDFVENTRLFQVPPPVINIESRQFPVTVHFNRKTYPNYLKEAYKKAVKIHTRLPAGGILIFVTGQKEVHYLVRKLKNLFPYRKDVDYSKIIQKNKPTTEDNAILDSEPDDIESDDDEVEKVMKRVRKARRDAKRKAKKFPKIDLADYDMPDEELADMVCDDGDSEGHLSDIDDSDDTHTPEIKSCRQPLWPLPLYSKLSSNKQARVFEPPPAGARLCVVSTDVAETSLTIPGIKYVVDTGKKKMLVYDHVTGASAHRVVWTSQASAAQRAGRAGRTGPGHAYRTYSAAVLQHDLPPQHPPDICRRPMDDLVLFMKSLGINKVVNFPFPTAPDREHIRMAEQRLEVLGLLEKYTVVYKKDYRQEEVMKATQLGIAVSPYPVLPRYGKMLALSHQQDLLPYVIAMVSAFSVPEIMSSKSEDWPATGELLLLGDLGVFLRVVGATEYDIANGESEDLVCAKFGVRLKAFKEIRKLRRQLTNEINSSVEGAKAIIDPKMPPPSDKQARLLRQLLLCGLGDQVARKVGLHEVKQGQDKRKFKYAYRCADLEEPVHLHSDSILRRTIPEWVVYQELYEAGADGRKKMIMKNVAAIDPEWLPMYVPAMCNLGEPLTDPEPRYDEGSGRVKCHYKGTFGKCGWQLPIVEIDFPESQEKYRWFARFFLEGSVFPKLRRFTRSLLSPPSTMIKSWAKLQPRTQELLNALISKRTGNKDQLLKVWEEEPKFMLETYLKWLPTSAHNDATLSWPPI